MTITIRNEQPADTAAIADLTRVAFQRPARASCPEPFIVNALRRAGQLTISLVAADEGAIIGHVAISPVTIADGAAEWYGLGPISVAPERQRQGIGSRLVQAALAGLRQRGAAGCVVLGNPAYYGRFGFEVRHGLTLPGVPPEHFRAISFSDEWPEGDVRYHAAFEATG